MLPPGMASARVPLATLSADLFLPIDCLRAAISLRSPSNSFCRHNTTALSQRDYTGRMRYWQCSRRAQATACRKWQNVEHLPTCEACSQQLLFRQICVTRHSSLAALMTTGQAQQFSIAATKLGLLLLMQQTRKASLYCITPHKHTSNVDRQAYLVVLGAVVVAALVGGVIIQINWVGTASVVACIQSSSFISSVHTEKARQLQDEEEAEHVEQHPRCRHKSTVRLPEQSMQDRQIIVRCQHRCCTALTLRTT